MLQCSCKFLTDTFKITQRLHQTSKTAARTVTKGESSRCFRISPTQPAEFTERKWCIDCYTAVSSCFQRLGVFSNTTNITRCHFGSVFTWSLHKHDFKPVAEWRASVIMAPASASGNFHRRSPGRARAGVEMICKWAPALYRKKRPWTEG